MSDYDVMSFQKSYPTLTKKFMDNEPNAFALGLLVAYASEVSRGFYVKKQLKTTNKGTRLNYEKFTTSKQVDEYKLKIDELTNLIDKEDCVNEILRMVESEQ